jgi:hypothetical protein
MLGVNEHKRYDLASHVVVRTEGCPAIHFLLDCKTGAQFTMSETAAEIVRLIGTGAGVKEICSFLEGSYFGADRVEIEQDVHALIEELVAAGLVTEIGNDSGKLRPTLGEAES